MSSEPSDVTPEFTEPTDDAGKTSRWPTLSTKTKVIIGVVTLVIVVIGYFFLQRFLPEWWARSMAHRIDGSFVSGTSYGLLFGILGSAVPLILGLLAVLSIGVGPKNALSWGLGVIALAFLIPNLLTLGVVIGDGNGATIGRRNLDVFAPAFRGATLIGVIVGIAIGIAADFYLIGRRREKRKQAKLAA
ncbi:hypothetical protein [Gordonia hydrophobica]|uniref:Permease n=1 Tax=Gordonia hydrophobica TaxID=40516 RepID=A0ABZ2U5Q9_9ACTN|nr:hypothetical protein [Gordonia hydrophobica]MBM7368781.1 F0F1-type ATP synthase assembly protein I [Gordonia hydrophobica]